MSVSATIDISGNLQAAMKGLKPDAMMEGARRGLDRGMQILAGKLIETRLTGKGPFPVPAHRLGVRSGRLRQSTRTTAAKLSGLEVSATIGSRVTYAAAHEFGFTGTVPVKAHERTIKKKGGRTIKKALRQSHPVKAHQRKITIPERAPFRTGIEENLGIIETEMAREVTTQMQSK